MAKSAIQICNSALLKIGARRINTFSDTGKEADLVRERYPSIRDAQLRGHVWAFAKRHAVLPALLGEVPQPWTYKHELPADTGRIIEISTLGFRIQFERVGNEIWSNHTPIELRYVRNFGSSVDDAFAFPDDFAEVVAYFLAADISPALTQGKGFTETYYQMGNDALRLARFNGAAETLGGQIEATGWLQSRETWTTDIDISARPL